MPSMIESTELRKDSEATEEDYSMINNYLKSNNKVTLVKILIINNFK